MQYGTRTANSRWQWASLLQETTTVSPSMIATSGWQCSYIQDSCALTSTGSHGRRPSTAVQDQLHHIPSIGCRQSSPWHFLCATFLDWEERGEADTPGNDADDSRYVRAPTLSNDAKLTTSHACFIGGSHLGSNPLLV